MLINGEFDLDEFLKIINPRSLRKPRPSPNFAKYQQILHQSRLKARSQTPTRPAVTELTEEDYKIAQQPREYFLFQRYHRPERLPPYRPSGKTLTQRFYQPHLGVPRTLPDKNNPLRAFLLLEPEVKKEPEQRDFEQQVSYKPISNDRLPILSGRSQNITPERSKERITPTKLTLRQNIQTTSIDERSNLPNNAIHTTSPIQISFHQDRPSPRFSNEAGEGQQSGQTDRTSERNHKRAQDNKKLLIPVLEEKMKQELKGFYWKYKHHNYKATDLRPHDHAHSSKNKSTYEKHLSSVLQDPKVWEEVNQSQEHKNQDFTPRTERPSHQNDATKISPGGYALRNRSFHKKDVLTELIWKKHQEVKEEQDDNKKLIKEIGVLSARLRGRKKEVN